jgi:hypothetical protein
MNKASHGELLALLTRRRLLGRASTMALGALVTPALPVVKAAGLLPGSGPTLSDVTPQALPDATLQAFADTILPGCMATRTDLGNTIHPLAIAGVDPLPGAVQADALELFHHPEIGFDALEPAFLTELDARSALHGADFLALGFPARVQVCLAGLDFQNPTRLVWEAAAAVPFTAFCAATLIRDATASRASGYRVMGLPGTAPDGYAGYSYGRPLSRELTRTGSLP